MENKVESNAACGQSMASQKASLSVPASTAGHKDPKIMPIGDKAMTGAKYN